MTREIIDDHLKRLVFQKYHGRCYVCDSAISMILRVHHIRPLSLGGTDKLENLVLLCPNCHALVHSFSAKRSNGKNISSLLSAEYKREAIERINELSEKIKQVSQHIGEAGNIWDTQSPNSRRPYTIEEAIASVAQRNRYTDEKNKQLQRVFSLILNHIPQNIKTKCSYRLLKQGRYISINIMNYLLFRSPGYGDLGGQPFYDCFLIFTSDLHNYFESFDERNVFNFRLFDCVNLGLAFDEVVNLSIAKWQDFSQACQMASKTTKSRNWVSNIQVR